MSHRRILIQTLLAATVLLTMPLYGARVRAVRHPEPPFNVEFTEGGYASATSVRQGSPITFHIASSVPGFTVTIVNLSAINEVLTELRGLASSAQNCSGRFTSGCGWDATTTFDVPRSWPSGYYAARFPTSLGERNIIFVVREDRPGSTSPILVISPTHTYQAYNEFGGRSLYPSNWPLRGTELSMNRPYLQTAGLGNYDTWERRFVDWMDEEERPFEVATDDDLEDPTLLGNYEAVVLVGHPEYWTASARHNLETFSRSGGHVAVLGGNTMWWQVRLEDQGRTLVGYKDALRDPLYGQNDALVTHHFFGHPVNNPEAAFLGTSFRYGGYANRVDDPNSYEMIPLEQRIPYAVTEPDHWIFQGTGVQRGTAFGQMVTGLEVDGALYNCDAVSGDLVVDGSDGAPLNYHILAVTPGSVGHGTLGFYVNSAGGALFNAATQHWVHGLGVDPVVTRMTENVLDRFATGASFLYDPVMSPILTQETFNCPQDTKEILPGWASDEGRGAITARCAYEGPGGLELSGPGQVEIARAFSSVNPRSDVHVRFYANVDALVKRNVFPSPLVMLMNRSPFQQMAYVEFDVAEDGSRLVRAARRGSAGEFAASSFVPLPNGWHLLELHWQSPGTITLQVDGGTPLTLANPESGQKVSDVIIEYPDPNVNAAGHACIDALAVATEKLGPVPALK